VIVRRHLTGPAHEAQSSKAAFKGEGRLIRYLQHAELRCLLGIALTTALLLETMRYGREPQHAAGIFSNNASGLIVSPVFMVRFKVDDDPETDEPE
jgi:hypothetical protein